MSAPKPKIEVTTSGDGNRAAGAHIDRLAVPTDRILTRRGGGDLNIYEEIASDAKVKSAFEQRRNAVIAKEWRVEAGGPKRIDKQAAEHLEAQLRRIGFDAVTDKMLWGTWYGYSIAEVIWDVEDGRYVWKAIKIRRRRKFKFTEGGELRRFDQANVVDGLPADAPYFWHFCTGADNDDDPYGMGLAHWCYWYVLFKRQGIKFWLNFLEKFATPTALGKYPVGATPDEQRKLVQAGLAIRNDSAIAVPIGTELDLIEAARSGTADYKVLYDTMNAAIEQVIIGQTAGSSGTPGKLGGEDLQGEVRNDIIKADADLVCESLNLGPVRWLTEANFAGAAMPRVFRVIEEPEDANTTAERDTKVKTLGFKPSLAYVREQYGDHWEEAQPVDQAPKVGPDGKPLRPPASQAPGEFAEGRNAVRELPDAIADRLEREAGPQLQAWIDRLQTAVEESPDFETFNERLLTEFAELPAQQLSDLVGQALLTAHLGGRAGVQDEADAERDA